MCKAGLFRLVFRVWACLVADVEAARFTNPIV